MSNIVSKNLEEQNHQKNMMENLIKNKFSAIKTSVDTIRIMGTQEEVILNGCLPNLKILNNQTGKIDELFLVFSRKSSLN
jgi:hypothetical protein